MRLVELDAREGQRVTVVLVLGRVAFVHEHRREALLREGEHAGQHEKPAVGRGGEREEGRGRGYEVGVEVGVGPGENRDNLIF